MKVRDISINPVVSDSYIVYLFFFLEGLINFKALRAKFQEEALLAQSKTSRPAVAEKPKHLPPPGGHCSSVVSSINIAVENRTPVVPRVIFRDGLRGSGGKRPISFPPQPQQTSPSSQIANGESTTRQSLKDRHMPLVLPALPVKEQKRELPSKKERKLESDSGKDVPPQTKIKKKGLLLPFKSAKASKVSTENGEEPTYADLTTRPSSAPGELPSVEKQTTEDGVSLQSDQSTTEFPLSSPDIPVTPPPAETSVDSENKISTLEKAKKKFSRRQMLISAKPKSLRSPDYISRDKALHSPPKNAESVEPELPVPPLMCLPHLACISARPFSKANNSERSKPNLLLLFFLVHIRLRMFIQKRFLKHFQYCISLWLEPALDKQFGKNKAVLPSVTTKEPHPPSAPSKKPLPDLRSLGPLPLKPPRPPLVDISCYHQLPVNGVLTHFMFAFCFPFV